MIQYKMTHFKKDCKAEFYPTKTYRLHADTQHAEGLKYQDLLEGTCPKCMVDVMAWIGINHMLETVKYISINEAKHAAWFDRFDTDLIKSHGKDVHNTVKGSIRDKKSGKWAFSNHISVA